LDVGHEQSIRAADDLISKRFPELISARNIAGPPAPSKILQNKLFPKVVDEVTNTVNSKVTPIVYPYVKPIEGAVAGNTAKLKEWLKAHKKELGISGLATLAGVVQLTPPSALLASIIAGKNPLRYLKSMLPSSSSEEEEVDEGDTKSKESTESFKHWGALGGGTVGGVSAALAAWELSKKRSDWERLLYSGLAAAGGAAAGGYAGSLLDK
jgi:hypothetical protein